MNFTPQGVIRKSMEQCKATQEWFIWREVLVVAGESHSTFADVVAQSVVSLQSAVGFASSAV